jgi:hypothetical protein
MAGGGLVPVAVMQLAKKAQASAALGAAHLQLVTYGREHKVIDCVAKIAVRRKPNCFSEVVHRAVSRRWRGNYDGG